MVDPNSLFQSSNFFRSVEATEGRVLAMAASKSAIQTGGGSAIWPFAFISCSCCGVLSATSRRTGAMSASRQTRAMSAPEYPGVASARTSGSTSAAAGVWATPSSNSLRRACRSGRGTRTRFSSLLSKASSRSQGQFVVASTVTGGGMCVAPSSSSSPSSPPPPLSCSTWCRSSPVRKSKYRRSCRFLRVQWAAFSRRVSSAMAAGSGAL
mmetsp:Transcript_39471/g.65055  ORF Transcript_39471/g.65055 Transcript_39471/m.65055 type:complete len:210 (-) Transcript_39471:1368-1997(-)